MGTLRATIALAGSLGIAALTTAFAGCKTTGNSSVASAAAKTESDGAVAAQEYFETAVYPSLVSACGSCHSAAGPGDDFLADNATDSYTLIENSVGLIADPTRSPLVTHVHTNPAITVSPEERNLLSQWLGMEVSARGLSASAVAAVSPTDAYNQFATCMNFDVWEYFGVGNLAFAQTDHDGPCLSCHSIGQGGAWMSADSRESFTQTQQFPFIEKWVVSAVDKNGNFAGLQPALRFIEKEDEACIDPNTTNCHPSYGLAPDVQEAISGFVSTTLENLTAHTCQTGVVTLFDASAGDAADAN